MLERNEYIYIATTSQYALHNQYKIGGSEKELKKRLSSYNCGRADGDNFYYCWIHKCHDYRTIESRIKSLFANWRVNKNKEMYILNYDFLVHFVEFLCSNNDSEVDIVNTFISADYSNSLAEAPIVPPPIAEFDGFVFEPPLIAGQDIPLLMNTEYNAIDSEADDNIADEPISPINATNISPESNASDPVNHETLPETPVMVDQLAARDMPAESINISDESTNINAEITSIGPVDLTADIKIENDTNGTMIVSMNISVKVAEETIRRFLQDYIAAGEAPISDINDKIKNSLDKGLKKKFKAMEWRQHTKRIAAEMGITIRMKKVK